LKKAEDPFNYFYRIILTFSKLMKIYDEGIGVQKESVTRRIYQNFFSFTPSLLLAPLLLAPY